MTTSAAASTRRRLAARTADAAHVFTPEQLTDEHRLIARTDRRVRRSGGAAPALDALEQKDWALARQLAEAMRRAGPAGRGRAGGLRRRRARQGLLADRLASGIARAASFGATCGGAGQPHSILPLLTVRHRRPEVTKYLPGLCRRRAHRRLRAQRSRVGLRRARARARADRQPDGSFVLNGREDVDHQRRLRRSVHRLREGRRRALHRVHRRARVRRRHERQGRAQDGPARLVDDAADPAGRDGAGGRTCSARSARATRSRSTC